MGKRTIGQNKRPTPAWMTTAITCEEGQKERKKRPNVCEFAIIKKKKNKIMLRKIKVCTAREHSTKPAKLQKGTI